MKKILKVSIIPQLSVLLGCRSESKLSLCFPDRKFERATYAYVYDKKMTQFISNNH